MPTPNPSFTLTNRVEERLLLGINLFDLPSSPAKSHLDEEIERVCAKMRALEAPPPGFAFSRRLYRGFGVDPTRHRPSSEALWRRVRNGLPFPRLLAAVDATNLISLELQVPFGLYDGDRIQGEVVAQAGSARDGYEGIGRGWINLAGKPMLRDDSGPFGNPSADSARTCVTAATNRLVHVIFFHPEDPGAAELTHRALHRFAALTGAIPLFPPMPT